MSALRLVMLLVAVPVCYLFFIRTQPAGNPSPTALPASEAHSQYKRDIDQARDAAKKMQTQRTEVDSM